MKKIILLVMMLIASSIALSYIPPLYDDVELIFDETSTYIVPSYDDVELVFDVGVTDICAYESGDYNLPCGCNVTSPTDLGDNNLIITGNGTTYITSVISGKNYIFGNQSYNGNCLVYWIDGGKFD